MTTAQMLAKVKEAMRIRHTALDTTLTDDINAGALELKRSGVSVFDNDNLRDDALIEVAVRYYVMAAEDYNGKASQYMQSFEKLRDAMAMSGDYKLTEDEDEG